MENAVRHGVLKKEEGGTVIIRSKETKDACLVMVEDDGVGIQKEPGTDDGSSKYTKIATTANNTYKYSGMQANKYYDFYIVANKKVGSKTWKSEASTYYRVWLY